MSDTKPYDVFLSYNKKDGAAVKRVAICLQDQANIKVWFDEWNLVPGEAWQEELEKALDMSKACAVFIGPSSIGPWHHEEMRSALQMRVEQNQFRIIPVLLPGAKLPERGKLPRFLSRLHSVDFRDANDLCQHPSFARLIAGIHGIAPGRDDLTPNLVVAEYPYRGLEIFDEEHARIFFGREALTQHLVEALRSTCFLAVSGASGCGKSSLARAGLLPTLKAGALSHSDRWTYIVFKPGANPLEELSINLVRAANVEDPTAETQRVLKNLKSDESSLHIYVRQFLQTKPKDSRVFILIDQFEEIFTHCKDQEEQTRFINNLRYAVTSGEAKTIITITMRADFFARASEQIELAEVLSGHQFLVSRMDETDFRQAIEEPALLVGLQFEKGLVDKILGDVIQEPGALPLLEDMLLQLCQMHRGGLLRLQDYVESGGVRGCLEKRADAIFDKLPSPQQLIATRILLRLTQPGEGAEDTRRRAALSELITSPDEQLLVEHVVNILADARLLTTYTEEGKEPQVDVAHEALIRGWPRLRQWIEENRESLRTHRRLAEAAQLWKENNNEESFLFSGARLEQTKEWMSEHEKPLSLLEQEFLNTSVQLQERGQVLRKRRRRLIILAVITVSALVGIAALLWYQRRQEDESRRLAAGVRLLLERGRTESNYYQILNLAVEAIETSHTSEAEDALRKAIRGSHVDYVHPQKVLSAVFSPDGKTILTVGADNVARLWDVVNDFGASPALIRRPRMELSRPDLIKTAIYSKDSEFVLTISGNNTGQVWDAQTGEMLHSKIQHNAAFRAVFSPDNKRIVTASNDQTVKVWDVESGYQICSLDHTEPVSHAEFSPNGKYMITVAASTKLWDANTFSLIHIFSSRDIEFATFSPDSKSVVNFNGGTSFESWNIDSGELTSTNEEQKKRLIASRISFGDISSDGKLTLAVDQGLALVKDTQAGNPYQEIREENNVPILSATFSPDNKLLLIVLSDSDDRSVRLYECDICGSFEELLNRAKERVGRQPGPSKSFPTDSRR